MEWENKGKWERRDEVTCDGHVKCSKEESESAESPVTQRRRSYRTQLRLFLLFAHFTWQTRLSSSVTRPLFLTYNIYFVLFCPLVSFLAYFVRLPFFLSFSVWIIYFLIVSFSASIFVSSLYTFLFPARLVWGCAITVFVCYRETKGRCWLC